MKNFLYNFSNDALTVYVEGSIDSTNYTEVEDAILEIIADNAIPSLVLDFSKVNYVSSAGLRIVLKLMRKHPHLRIINVSNEVYDIFDMTGFSKMISVEKAYRVLDVTDCPIIGEGAKGIVYRYSPDTIVKVYKNSDVLPLIKRERELAQKALIMGIPTAISYDVVKVGNNYGSVFELLDCDSMSKLISTNPDKVEQYACEYAKLLRIIHNTKVIDKKDMKDQVEVVKWWIENDSKILDKEYINKLKNIVSNIKSQDTLIHGDFHTNNVMMQNGESILIDMDTLAYGNPIFELAVVDFTYNIMNKIDETNVEKFIGITHQTSDKFYKYFIKYYFENTEITDLDSYLKVMDILSLARVISHLSRRNAPSEKIEKAKAELTKLLEEV